MLRRLIAALNQLFSAPEPESVALTRRVGEQLSHCAGTLRETAARARTLSARIEYLTAESAAWERRLRRARQLGDEKLLEAAAKMCGRVSGELAQASAELKEKLDDEMAMRERLIQYRKRFFGLANEIERMGHDASSCMTTIDLSRPPPTDDDGLPDDEERDFVARLIDQARAAQ